MKRMLLTWSPAAILAALLISGTVAGNVRTQRDREYEMKVRRLERELDHVRAAAPAAPARTVTPPAPAPAPAVPAKEPEDAGVLLRRGDVASCLAALKMIEERRLVEHLPWMLEQVRRRDNQLLRVRIAEVLGSTGSGDALTALREEWTDADLSFKRAAAASLRDMGDAAYADAFLDEAAGHLTLPSGAMRAAAVYELGRFGGAKAEALIAQAKEDPHPDVRLVARRASKR